MSSPVHHSLNYVELGSTDLKQTKQFYSNVFGWEFTDYGPTYIAFNNGGTEGGFTTEMKVQKGPLPVLYSHDLEASKVAVEKQDGTVVVDIFDFPGGRRFHFIDPSGNELAVWSDK